MKRFNYQQKRDFATISELPKDFKVFKKYVKYFIGFLVIATALVYYSYLNFQIEHEITTLTKQKSMLIAENYELKKDITVLSSPERIGKIAKNKYKMKVAPYSEIKFIENNE